MNPKDIGLTLVQRLFLKLYCFPPPGRESTYGKMQNGETQPLQRFERVFGDDFFAEIKDKVVLDIGCGGGAEVIGAIRRGARFAIGLDSRAIFLEAMDKAEESGISNKVEFSTKELKEVAPETIDILLSQNSFEHFSDPLAILQDGYKVLRSNGKFFITFAPPWLNPFGVHMFFMIKYPWAHLLFSERTIMTVRRLYRDDNAIRYEEVEGGLNKMTIRKFERLIDRAGFEFNELIITPIRRIPSVMVKIPFLREFVTSTVSAVLTKKG